MSITYKLIDDAHFPDGVEVVGAPVLPRVGDGVSVRVYENDQKKVQVEGVVTSVRHDVQRCGMTDGRESALAEWPTVRIEPSLAAIREDIRAIGRTVKARDALIEKANGLLDELQASLDWTAPPPPEGSLQRPLYDKVKSLAAVVGR